MWTQCNALMIIELHYYVLQQVEFAFILFFCFPTSKEPMVKITLVSFHYAESKFILEFKNVDKKWNETQVRVHSLLLCSWVFTCTYGWCQRSCHNDGDLSLHSTWQKWQAVKLCNFIRLIPHLYNLKGLLALLLHSVYIFLWSNRDLAVVSPARHKYW